MEKAPDTQSTIESIYQHLVAALELLDGIDPNSILGARLQHIIDDIGEQRGAGTPRQAGEPG